MKEKVVSTARKLMNVWVPEVCDKPGHCLYLAACTCYALHTEGIRGVIQAGTCYWPRMEWEDDESQSNVFGYKW